MRWHPPQNKTYDGRPRDTLKHIRALDHLCAGDHTDIGCPLYSSMNTSPCVSSRKHRTKRLPRCASRPRPTSSPASLCSSAESTQTMWAFGPQQPPVRLRTTGRLSGRRLSALMRCARPIARCSVCWSGVGWKLCESSYQDDMSPTGRKSLGENRSSTRFRIKF